MISSSWTSQPCLLRACRVWSLCVNKQRNSFGSLYFDSKKMESPFFELLLGGSTMGTVCFWHCSSLQDGVIVWDLGVRFAAGCVGCCRSWLGYIEFLQLLIHIVLSPDVLCCSFVYLDTLLRSHAFSPKRLELVLKVVVWCFFLPSGLCPFPVSMSCCPGNSWEL